MAEETNFPVNFNRGPGGIQTPNQNRNQIDLTEDEDEENRIGAQEEEDMVEITQEGREANQTVQMMETGSSMEQKMRTTQNEARNEQPVRDQDNVRPPEEGQENPQEARQAASQETDADRASIRDLADTAGANRTAENAETLTGAPDRLAELNEDIRPTHAVRQRTTQEAQEARAETIEEEARRSEPLFEIASTNPVRELQEREVDDLQNAAEEETGFQQQEEDEQQANPAAVQTEVGQNIDRLV